MCSVSGLTPGKHVITASYPGYGNCAAGSKTMTVTVKRSPSTFAAWKEVSLPGRFASARAIDAAMAAWGDTD
jgi:hypothetical protein